MIDFNINLTFAIIFFSLLGYLIGSVPFGLVITKINGVPDIRKSGSGNIGATNVFRTGKKGLAVLTLIFDISKGYISVIISIIFIKFQIFFEYLDNFEEINYLLGAFSGFFCILGHCFPIWLKFKGGKGVASSFGIILAFDFLIGVVTILIWISIFYISRISSLSAMISFFICPFLFLFYDYNSFLVTASFLASLLIFFKHRTNISRLINKQESKF